MKAKKNQSWKRQYWYGIAAVLLAGLIVIANAPAWAAPSPAPLNQTVPLPTATSEPSKLPTATPSKDDSDDDDDDSASEPDPTETPEPDPLLPPVDTDTTLAGGVGNLGITGEVVVANLNVREGPGVEYAIIGTASNGDIVTLLARSADGVWWALCCVGDEGLAGWASAQFIRPSVGRAEANNALPVVASLDDLLARTTVASTTEDAAAGAVETATEGDTTELRLAMTQSPPYVLQGGHVDLTLVVTNIGENDAAAVVLSDQLPEGLTFVSAAIDADGIRTQSNGDGGAVIITTEWPLVAAGESVTAVLTLQVATDLPGGAVIDNLAAVTADNAEGDTAGVSIGTVPNLLPNF